MKLGPLSAGLIGALAMLAGPVRLPIGEQPVMASKANADESGKGSSKVGRAPSMPMARDPAVAVAEEYAAARQKATREAFELFIARHGDHPLAEEARSQLRRFSR
ncbi:hypothetical protein [Bradyrhizobium vignae]|uniref:DUF4148 domain-containing protein n=1 Tax=Bradyrhizobium vignae TaxID=1549949 RepID=A0ABS3ZZW8_9BRAD|nr:hypothetical protein [Bradyrhizobium vignae]MBP0113295.1 hypothetical protein [Bradyrhizobium vignae]